MRAKVRVLFRNLDETANERAELARLLNKARTCFLHEAALSAASAVGHEFLFGVFLKRRYFAIFLDYFLFFVFIVLYSPWPCVGPLDFSHFD
jgi:hypothetical protein